MKANKAPERIYCESDGLGNIVKVHNSKWPDDEAENIEYIRKGAFIEKAKKWMLTHTFMFQSMEEVDLYIDMFIEEMKGEEV